MDYRHDLGHNFGITVVRLMDGYLGQVSFGGRIIHQTDLVPESDQAHVQAADNALGALVDALKKLF